MSRRWLAAAVVLASLALPSTAAAVAHDAVPRARIGMNYFDGWTRSLAKARRSLG